MKVAYKKVVLSCSKVKKAFSAGPRRVSYKKRVIQFGTLLESWKLALGAKELFLKGSRTFLEIVMTILIMLVNI